MNLIYHFVRYTIGIACTVYFRKIFITGRERIKKDKKTIIALNHPTACIEPLIFGTLINKHIQVLLRGDAFLSKPVEWFLRKIKTIPIFRQRDGVDNLRKNEQIMNEIEVKIHDGNDAILVLAEGTSKHEKRLRTVKKGAARMMFQTYEKYGDTDISIVPVSVNYTDSHRFRSTVSFQVEEPILLENYLDLYKENKARAIKKVTSDLQNAMREEVIHIADSADDDMVNLLLEFNRNEFKINAFPYVTESDTLTKQEWNIVEKINKKSKEERTKLAAQTDAYVRRLNEYRAEDHGAAQPYRSNFINWILLFFGFPLHLAGLIWNYPPLRFAKHFADKKSSDIRFHASLRLGVGYIAWLIWYALWIVLGFVVSNWVGGIAVALLMPVSGRISLLYSDLREEVSSAFCYNSLPDDEKVAIQKMRDKLLAQVR